MKEPTKEDIKMCVESGYTWPRLANRYSIGIKRMKTIARQWPEIERQIIYNGKLRTKYQQGFGNYMAGGF